MARQTLIHLHTSDPLKQVPLSGDSAIQLGEIAINYATGKEKIQIKNADNEIVEFLSNDQVKAQIDAAVQSGCDMSGDTTDSITTVYADKKITANLNVDPKAKNALEVTATGVYVADKTEDIAANTAAIEAEKTRAEGVEAGLRTDVDAKVASVTAADKSITIGGTATAPTVKAAISATEGNALSLAADGLMVTIPEEQAYTGKDAITVTDHEIGLKIDANDKVLSQGVDGLKVNLALNFNSATGVITLQGNGEALSTVDLPVESILKSAVVTDKQPSGATGNGPWLVLVFNTSAGDQTQVVDLNKLIDVYTAGNGIAISNNVVSAKIDAASESFLTVGADGIKLAGVQTAINTAKAAAEKTATDAVEALANGAVATNTANISTLSGAVTTNTTNIETISGNVTSNTTKINQVEQDYKAADTQINNKIDEINETLTGETTGFAAQIAANKAAIEAEVTRATGAEQALSTKVTALETTVGDSTKGLVKDVADNKSAITTLNGEESVAGSVKNVAKSYADSAQAAAIAAAAQDATTKANAAQAAATEVANTKIAAITGGSAITATTTTGDTKTTTVNVKLGASANASGAVLSTANGLEIDNSALVINCGEY